MHSHDEVEVKKVDRVSPTVVRLTIAFPGKTLVEHEKSMANQYSKQAALPGFRPGKAPLKMVLEKYRDKIRQDVVQHLLEAGLSEAIQKTKLSPVSRPKIALAQLDFDGEKPLEFHAEFEVEPEVHVKNYKGVPIKSVSKDITDEEVNKTVENLRERLAILEPSDDKTPTKGCFAVVEVGFHLVEDPSKHEDPTPFTVELGTEKLIPEIDKALMGMSVGEAKTVEGTFPDDYNEKPLAGKKASFDCKLIELKKRTLPELNDAFAETVRPGMTLLALKADIRKNLQAGKESEVRRAQRQSIIDYVVKKNSFDVPQSMVEMQSQRLLQSMSQDLQARGQTLPQLKEDELKAVRNSAEEIVRGGLVLKRIASQENISLSDLRVKERIAQLAEQWKQTPDDAQKFLESQGVLDRIKDEVLTDQIFDFLIENAKPE